MKIVDIKESGCNNILMWALSNGANVKTDDPLMSLINDELFYLVTIGDVNFFELFRLTQAYRDKIRICDEKPAAIPTRNYLRNVFPGDFDHEGEKVAYAELAENGIAKFMALVSQMTTDDDIIPAGAVRLFLPMITRTFDVQIPVSFVDMIQAINDDEYGKLFNQEYPNTLQGIIEAEMHSFKNILGMAFVRHTQIIKYDQRYDKYLKAIKYAPLKAYEQKDKLYKLGLIGFFKRDNISRGEVRCSLFKPNSVNAAHILKRISKLNTPLESEFVIQMPLQYIQTLENSFSREDLPILYESSMSNILDNGLVYENFETSKDADPHPAFGDEEVDDEKQAAIEKHLAEIDSYRIRIAEANETVVKTFPFLLNSEEDVDVTSIFAMLPSIYMMNAVITVNSDNLQKFIGHSDPVISEMFQEISNMISSINEDIRKAK